MESTMTHGPMASAISLVGESAPMDSCDCKRKVSVFWAMFVTCMSKQSAGFGPNSEQCAWIWETQHVHPASTRRTFEALTS
jgi:hypothetical protein